MNAKYKQQIWLSKEELSGVKTASYWNDREIERAKNIFDVSDGDFGKVEKRMEEKGILRHVENMLEKVNLKGVGMDLGAGICWLEPILLSKFPEIEKMYCVEFSTHRLLEIAPLYLDHFKVAGEKCELCQGSFYDLKLEDHSIDFAAACQSFHHAIEPESLLKELKRVLKKNASLVVIAEDLVEPKTLLRAYTRHFYRYFAYADYRKGHSFLVPYMDLYRDDVKGDTHYLERDYHRLFKKYGFTIRHKQKDRRMISFIAENSSQ